MKIGFSRGTASIIRRKATCPCPPQVTSQVCNHLINTGRQVNTSSPYFLARSDRQYHPARSIRQFRDVASIFVHTSPMIFILHKNPYHYSTRTFLLLSHLAYPIHYCYPQIPFHHEGSVRYSNCHCKRQKAHLLVFCSRGHHPHCV